MVAVDDAYNTMEQENEYTAPLQNGKMTSNLKQQLKRQFPRPGSEILIQHKQNVQIVNALYTPDKPNSKTNPTAAAPPGRATQPTQESASERRARLMQALREQRRGRFTRARRSGKCTRPECVEADMNLNLNTTCMTTRSALSESRDITGTWCNSYDTNGRELPDKIESESSFEVGLYIPPISFSADSEYTQDDIVLGDRSTESAGRVEGRHADNEWDDKARILGHHYHYDSDSEGSTSKYADRYSETD